MPGYPKSMVKPTISVVIPNWNGLHHLDACLSALRAQVYTDFETILVDNGSRDESLSFVRQRFPEVDIVTLDANRGFAGAVNAGLAVAQGEFIALLNNDTLADPGWLRAIHCATQEREGYGMWASRVVLFDQPELLDSAGDGMTVAGAPFKRGHLEMARAFERDEEVFAPSGAAAVYRRVVIEDAGGLDEDFFLIHEDVDLALRARLGGHRCRYVAGAIVRHKVNASIGYMSREYVFYGQRNLEYVFWKNFPAPLLLRLFPAHCLFTLLALCHFTLRGHGLTFLRAKGAALAGLPTVWQKRRSVQTKRRTSAACLLGQLERRWFRTKWRSAREQWPR